MQNSCKQNKKQTSFCFHDHHDLDDACKTLPAHSPFNFGSVWLLGAMSTDTAEPQTDAKMFPVHFDSTHHDDDRDHDPKWTITFDAAIWNQKKRRRGRALPKKQPGKETIFQNFFWILILGHHQPLGTVITFLVVYQNHSSCNVAEAAMCCFERWCKGTWNLLTSWCTGERDMAGWQGFLHETRKPQLWSKCQDCGGQKKQSWKSSADLSFLLINFILFFSMRLIFFA